MEGRTGEWTRQRWRRRRAASDDQQSNELPHTFSVTLKITESVVKGSVLHPVYRSAKFDHRVIIIVATKPTAHE